MTFQVVLIGSDGLLVGSDRRQTYYTRGEAGIGSGSTQMNTLNKFIANDSGTLICATAGGPTAELTGRIIATECNPAAHLSEVDWKNCLGSVVANANLARKTTDEITIVRTDIWDRALVVVCSQSSPQPTITCIRDWLCLGLSVPARFLPWHFWRRAPISKLKNLALAALFYAEQEHPSLIGGGYDIMMLDKKKRITWLTGNSIPHIQGFADEIWDSITRKTLP